MHYCGLDVSTHVYIEDARAALANHGGAAGVAGGREHGPRFLPCRSRSCGGAC